MEEALQHLRVSGHSNYSTGKKTETHQIWSTIDAKSIDCEGAKSEASVGGARVGISSDHARRQANRGSEGTRSTSHLTHRPPPKVHGGSSDHQFGALEKTIRHSYAVTRADSFHGRGNQSEVTAQTDIEDPVRIGMPVRLE